MAAPVVPMAAPMTPSMDWTGFYAGAQYMTGGAGDGITYDTGGYGIHAGCLRDLGSLVVGDESNYDVLTVNVSAGVDADVARLKAIAGYDLGAFMPYLTAGVAAFDFDTGFRDTVSFYGLGATYAINDNYRIGGEYLVHNKDDFDGGGPFEADTFSLRIFYSF